MKNAAEYARKVKRLANKLKREGGGGSLPAVEDPIEQLLRGVLTDFASESRAASALSRLREAVVDLNELRVTPASEIVEIIGVDFPMCRRAAESLTQSLTAIYNKTHHVDLSFFKTVSRKTAEQFLNSLVGFNAHARATIVLRCLGGHVVPVDATMLSYLRKTGCVPPEASVDDVQRFLSGVLKDSEGTGFYVRLKRYAATHAPRKGPDKEPSPVAPTPREDTETATKKDPPARYDGGKKSPAKPAKPANRKALAQKRGKTRAHR